MRNPSRLVRCSVAGACLTLAASAADAQLIRGPGVVSPVGPVTPGPFVSGVGAVGYGGYAAPYARRGYGGGGYGGGTASAANRIGAAAVIGAEGRFLKDSGEAAKLYEDAKEHWVENQLTAFKVYQTKKQIGEDLRDRQYEEDRDRAERRREQTSNATPDLLGRNDLDPSTGKLRYPVALKTDAFDAARQRLDDLFAIRAHGGGSPETGQDIVNVTGQMLDGLRDRIRMMPPPEYLQARSFLEAAQNEGRYR